MTKTRKIASAFVAAVAVLICALFVVIPQTTAHAADAWDGTTIATAFAGGDGTSEATAYEISTPAELAYLAQQVNAGTDYSGSYFKLTADIDLGGKEWTPIGNNTTYFTGKFSGNGNVIENISISSGTYVGLFCYNKGTIMNVGIASGSISGTYAGGICVDNYGTISGCYNNADITGSSQFAGGICYKNYGTIENCLNSGSVNNTYVFAGIKIAAGGIAGYNDSEDRISNCINIGSISSEDEANAIVGFDSQQGRYIINCYYLDITAEHALYFDMEADCYSDSGKLTLTELLVLDIDGENGTVWSAGDASFTAEDVTVDEDNAHFGTASVKLPYLTVFGEDAAPTAEADVYNFSLTDTPDWQTYTPITTAAELQAVNDDLDGNYVLMNDIDLDGVTWTPIGTIYDGFTGKLSGDGHVIENITISSGTYVGLFVNNDGLIMNVGIASGSISGTYVGGICVYNDGTIFGCYNNADITGNSQFTGGICRTNYGTIDNCLNSGSVNNTRVYAGNTIAAGGIAGDNSSDYTISNCINIGSVSSEDEANAIVGVDEDYGEYITNCYYLDSTAEHALYFNDYMIGEGYSDSGKLTLAELLVLDIDGENGTVWSVGDASFTAEDVTADEDNARFGTASVKLPYLTAFGEDAAQTAEVDVYNFSLTDTPDWQTYTPITTAAELQAIKDDLDGNYVLLNDIDLANFEWTPIGTIYDGFTGKLSGDGHVIKNISISSGTYVGLFANNNGLIMNIGIASGSISGTSAGGICVDNYGTIFGCYNNADITGDSQYTGGICYTNYGTIDNCLNSGSVNNTWVDASITIAAGGIVGYNGSEDGISNCINIGSISSEDEANAIVGADEDYGEYISNCYYLDSTAEHALYYNDYGDDVYSDSGKKTLAELCALDIDGENGTVWSVGAASFTAEDVTADEDNARFGTAPAKLPYLTVFGEDAATTAEVDVYNFSLTDTPDWQTYTPITTAAELQAVSDDLDGNYVLMNDIDLDGVAFIPIGDFTGKFSGNGHVVKNLTISTQGNYIGLFDKNRGIIMNLGVEGTVTNGSGYCVGGIIGGNYGTVSGCYFKGDVSGEAWQGGIAGGNSPLGIIDNCFAIGSVTSSDASGGIVGINNGTISDCYCVSTVTVTGTDADKGGVCGENSGTITNCFYNKDIYTDEDNTEGVDGLLTLDMTAGNALDTFGFDTDVWGYKAADKENGIAYYPYLKAFGEESAASVSYETKLSIEYDEDKGTPVYGEDLHFIISALVKFDGMEEFAPAVDSYADGEGSFRLTCADTAITEYFPIYDCAVLEMKTEFPTNAVLTGEQTICLEYIADDSDFFCDLSASCTITVAKAVIDSVTIEIDAPQPEVALDMEPVVTPEGMYYELIWLDDCNDNVNGTDGEYGNTYRAFFWIWTDGNHKFADTVTVTAPTEDFEVELDGDLYVDIYFPTLPEDVKPYNVTAAIGDGEITLTWDEVEGADLYRIRRNDGSGWVNYADVAVCSYIDTDVENGTSYKYAVYARVDGEWSNASDIVTAVPAGTVTITCAEYIEDGVYLEWTTYTDAEAYRVRRNDGTGWVNYEDIDDIYFGDYDVEQGKSYRYAVYVKVDGKWSEASNIVTVTVPTEAVYLEATADTDNITLEWYDTGADLYRIRRNDGTGWVNYADVTETSYTDTAVTVGKQYRYAVYARSNGKWSEPSNIEIAAVNPAAAENVTAVEGNDGVTITWDEVESADGYRIRRNDGSGWVNYADVTETSYTDTDVTAGKYYYAVYVQVNGVWSKASDIVSAAIAPIAAENITATATSGGVLIEWDEVDGADFYRIRRNDGSGWVNYTDLTVCSLTDTKITAGTTYKYAVYVSVNGAWSGASAIVSATAI